MNGCKNKVFLISGAVMMSLPLCGDGGLPPVEVVPVGVWVNYHDVDMAGERNKIFRGTELSLYLKMKEEGAIAYAGSREQENEVWHDTMLLKDSNIKNLGNFKGIRRLEEYVEPERHQKICFSFEHVPSPGAKWLKLTGEIPVRLLINKQITETVECSVKPGEKKQVGNFRISINEEDVEKHNIPKGWKVLAIIATEIEEKVAWRGMEFNITDANGQAFDAGKFRVVFQEGEMKDNRTERYTEIWAGVELPEKINISVTWWDEKEMMLPIDVKFDLYPAKKSF